MTVYVVWYQDEWDYDYHTYLHGIYVTKEKAEKIIEELENPDQYFWIREAEVQA